MIHTNPQTDLLPSGLDPQLGISYNLGTQNIWVNSIGKTTSGEAYILFQDIYQRNQTCKKRYGTYNKCAHNYAFTILMQSFEEECNLCEASYPAKDFVGSKSNPK